MVFLNYCDKALDVSTFIDKVKYAKKFFDKLYEEYVNFMFMDLSMSCHGCRILPVIGQHMNKVGQHI